MLSFALHYSRIIPQIASIPEIASGKRHDQGQITYLTQKTENIVEDKEVNRQQAFLIEHENFN